NAGVSRGDRPRDRGLPLQGARRGAGVVHRLHVGSLGPGVSQCQAHGLAAELVDALVEMAAERRHADTDDVNIAHGGLLQRRVDWGARFSAKARRPSRKSAERRWARSITCSCSSASARVLSALARATSFMRRIAMGLLAAIDCASASVASGNASAACTSLTRPSDFISAADRVLPVYNRYIAVFSGTSRGSTAAPPAPG